MTPPRAIGTPAAAAISWQNAFELSDPRRRAGPEHRDAGLGQRVGDPRSQRRLGADHDQLQIDGARQVDDGRGPWVERSTAAGRAARAPIASDPGATTRFVHARLRGRFQASACSRPPPPTTRIRVGW